MKKDLKYLQISDYIQKKNFNCDYDIFVGKTKKSHIIGPLINDRFDFNSFYKRLLSSSIYEVKSEYSKLSDKKAMLLLEKYCGKISLDNLMLEIFGDGEIKVHNILNLAGEIYEEK